MKIGCALATAVKAVGAENLFLEILKHPMGTVQTMEEKQAFEEEMNSLLERPTAQNQMQKMPTR